MVNLRATIQQCGSFIDWTKKEVSEQIVTKDCVSQQCQVTGLTCGRST